MADLEGDSEVICFGRLPHDKLVLLARHVLSQEGLVASDREVDEACRAAEGDARSMLNVLQSGLKGSTDKAESMLESACHLLYPDKPVSTGVLFKATSEDVLGTTSAYFENYLDTPELAPDGAQLLSAADMVEARLFQRQDWDLLPYVGLIGCASALSRPVISQRPLPRRLGKRSEDTGTRSLGRGSTRNKAAFISVKQKQESSLRPQLLLEGHGDASLERLAFLEHCLRSFPSAVERKDLQRLQRVPYMVAEKTDGVRYLLAVVGGSAALVGRNMATIGVSLAGGKLEGDLLLDGELVSMKRDPTSRLFVVYDALRTSRGQVASLTLRGRLEALTQDFFDKAQQGWTLVLPNHRKVPVQRKGLVPFQEGYAYSQTVAPALPYHSDGLVFTPVDEPIRYGTCPTLFKWKVLEANTVDFLIDHNGSHYTLSLVDRGREVAVAETCLAEGSIIKMIVDMDIQQGKRPIYECAWDPRSNTWQPRKARRDKAQPNSIMTLRATIKNLEEDVRLEDIFPRV
ncbi:mRNA capping enzyme family protein [Klebsormidium nitens]|uniref:mRNA guanylyltransferase n=1 Tax=Klebsormidium nitens TaxID=105231 RepID=A0A1Y1IJG4_KLENI|nr:mRNA capping enzyme family protein [Klebsormidium nitens]|eukprot:GAQ91010.1 mRNA capping enzyme family protein [Klebsormidium nitens]